MTTSRTTVVPSAVGGIAGRLVMFRFAVEGRQPLVPETLEEGHQLLEPLGPRPIQTPRAGSTLAHEAGISEDAQVLGDRGPRDLEMPCDLTGGELGGADQRENLSPPRLC